MTKYTGLGFTLSYIPLKVKGHAVSPLLEKPQYILLVSIEVSKIFKKMAQEAKHRA